MQNRPVNQTELSLSRNQELHFTLKPAAIVLKLCKVKKNGSSYHLLITFWLLGIGPTSVISIISFIAHITLPGKPYYPPFTDVQTEDSRQKYGHTATALPQVFLPPKPMFISWYFVKSIWHKRKWSNRKTLLENREARSRPDVCSGIIEGYLLTPDTQEGKTEKDQVLKRHK